MRASDIVEMQLCFSHQPVEIVVAVAAGNETMLEPGKLVPDLREIGVGRTVCDQRLHAGLVDDLAQFGVAEHGADGRRDRPDALAGPEADGHQRVRRQVERNAVALSDTARRQHIGQLRRAGAELAIADRLAVRHDEIAIGKEVQIAGEHRAQRFHR